MKNTVLVTPENWFNLPAIVSFGAADHPIELTLVDADGRTPLGDLALDELRALHHTFCGWWPALGSAAPAAGLSAGTYDRFVADHRALLGRAAEAALASDNPVEASHRRLVFPSPGHPVLDDSVSALGLLRAFLFLQHSASFIAWARNLAADDEAAATSRRHAWIRLVLQKAAADEELPEALACLRLVYTGDAVREALLAAEARALETCGLTDLTCWARSLGLDRPERTGPRFEVPARREPRTLAGPDITVLVPSYGHERFIEATLHSVLAQTYTNFHLLVVDDRSPDATVERAARIDDRRLQIQVNDTNLGLGDSVLRALATIDTPYVALLNSDDLFHPDRLERCRSVLERSAGTQVVATGLAPIDADGRRLTTGNVRRLFDSGHIADWIQWFSAAGTVPDGADPVAELLERNFLITSSNIVCRTEFLRSRADAIRGLKYCLDWQVFLDAAVDRALVHLPEELLGYRLHASNTVWFDDERRKGYALEVNRVLASAVSQLVGRSGRPGEREPVEILDLIANRAAKHSEAHGLALYAADLLNGRLLDAAGDRAHVVLGGLPQTHNEKASPRDAIATTAARVLAEIAQDDAAAARRGERDLADELRRYEAARQESEEALRVLHEQLEKERQEARDDLRRAADELRRTAEELRLTGETLHRISEERSLEKAEAERVAADLQRAIAGHVADIARLRSSPEWHIGDTVWNRAGLSRVAARAVPALRALRDRRNRWTLAARRVAHQIGLARPAAVVASCWNFPIHSHTFVYEEMTALQWAGFDCRVFCCGTNPKSELHPAFEPLWRRRVVLESDWQFNRCDYDHFCRTRPERVIALLAKLSQATGLTRDELLQQSIVMMGFTFARHVELSGAKYLHTYFFYDQSFLALVAGFLLEIPRGVTAYADHMLGDYAFKCVPLHLELADVVVATSSRIRGELCAIGGGRFDAKIIVKPNGINTARFPYVDAATRLKADGCPELISISRIEPKKGLVYLVEAMAILKARGISVRLNIVGGPDQNSAPSQDCFHELKSRIDELQLTDCVVLHGILKQPAFMPLMMKSRVFVAPYVEVASGDKDGIPTAVIEAMSTGLPVIATDAGSILEAVADGSEAIAVPQRDPAGLANAIEKLLADPALYARMSDAARHRAVTEFDVHVTEKRLHERILSARRPRPVPAGIHEAKAHRV